MKDIHDGDYGNHSGGRSLAHKVWTQGYYWPRMHESAKEYVKKCQKCQFHAHDYHAPAGDLNIIETPWPFAIWDMDIVGPLPNIKKGGNEGVRWILALSDYFIKWVKAIALTEVKHKDVIKFMKENILMRFGTPHAIIMDNGSQFTAGATKTFFDEQGINNKYSAPYYSESNG